VLDKNRKLRLAGVLTVVLSRMFNAPEVFSDEDIFRNVRSERLIVRKSMYDWLKRAKRIEGHPEGYRILDRTGIAAAISALRASPIPTVNGFLNFRIDEEEEEDEPGQEEDEKTDAEDVTGEVENVEAVVEERPEPEPEAVPVPADENYPEESEADIDVPPVKDTLRELESMISDAGTKNRARYVLSIHALTVMLGYSPDGTFSTRKDMFTLRKSIRHEKCVANEVFAKSWQKVFLDRTEEVGLTEKTLTGRESAYRIADGRTNEVIKMVSDAVHLDGLSLRKILWPGQYGDDEEAQEPEEAQEARQDGAVEVLTELVGQLTSVAESMSHVNDSMKAILTGLSELGEQSRERERRAQDSLERILGSLSSVVSRLDTEERDAIVSMKDRLVEIQTRRKSLSNQLESEVVREEKLIEEIDSVLGKKKS
jgi:hypothetical protein